MNDHLNNFISLFSITEKSVIEETFIELKLDFKTKELISIPNTDQLRHIAFLNKRDSLKISVLIGDDDPIDYYSSIEPDSFFREVSNRLQIRDTNEEIEIHFVITKNNIDGITSVYFPSELLKYLLSLDFYGILYVIKNAFGQYQFLSLESQSEAIDFNTNAIYFSNNVTSIKKEDIVFRAEKINFAKSICSSNLLNAYDFIPNDFFVNESSDQQFADLFNRICIIYSIVYLYDITAIEKSIIDYKLNGYKSIKGTLNFFDIHLDHSNEYFKIFDWCYNGGNFNDKVGLAKNIISLHLETPDKIDLKGNPYQSIQSSYKVYEKQNIQQYIEIRNKISDQLLSFHDRANNIIETFASGFQKSALALISFYISAIVIKLLGKDDLINVFTLDATILSMAFIICSYMYFRVSLWEVNEQKQRFVNNYNNLKERYLDLLDPIDIQRILNNDKEFNSDLAFIDNKRKKYSQLWTGYLLTLLFVTLFLFFIYNISHLLNSRLWRYLFNSCNSTN